MAEPNDLLVTVQEPRSWSRRLIVTVPQERVQRTRRSVAQKVAGSVRLPGFRKGKTPSNLVERQFAPQIEQETLDRVIQDAYREALDQSGFHPITQGMVENVQYEERSDLVFEVEFEVQPEPKLERINGFHVVRPSLEVGEAEVDSVLERLRVDRAVMHPLDQGARAETGDEVTVEITDLDEEGAEAQPYRFALGEGQAIPDIEAAILSLGVGEEGDFTARFPDDFPDEAQRGNEQRLHLKLLTGRRRELPEMDDELARSLGDFADVGALRERILQDLKEDAGKRAENELRSHLVQQIVEANPFDVPDSMVDRYLDFMTGTGERDKRPRDAEQEERISQFREALRPQAEASLKRMLVVETLADREGLRATQDDVDARVEQIATQQGRTPSQVWLELEKSGQLQALENEITEDRVFQYLVSQNNVA